MNKLVGGAVISSILALTGCNTFPVNNGNGGSFSAMCSGSVGPSKPERGVLIFGPTKNKCLPIGGMEQRNEIIGPKFSQNSKRKYVLEADLSMIIPEGWRSIESTFNHRYFTLFQVASQTKGCWPATTYLITPQGSKKESGFNYKNAESGKLECSHSSKWGTSDWKMPIDGTVFNLRVEFDFLGDGKFHYDVFADGLKVDEFDFTPPEDSITNKNFAIKFGAYSRKIFDYELKATNFKVDRVSEFTMATE